MEVKIQRLEHNVVDDSSYKGEEYGCHSGSSPVQIQPEGQDNSGSIMVSQHQAPDVDNCDWPTYELDQAVKVREHQSTGSSKYGFIKVWDQCTISSRYWSMNIS
ncbi:uncharacterized protein LOC111051761 isoform X2 [Nilaparvata lugens]|uniref:uncharacterized protein LOC111051761 isoform X2 n=1 Tax=Nilaparvata lugens TaxID=108931 RepID=UPI00193EAD66|nr:uncharacterized protein LOC111051761 isoform X2 [Nilaparvata lugens]